MSSFKLNTLLAAIGNFSTTASLAFVLFGIARLTDSETVGRFSYALAIVAPVFLLAGMRLRDISVGDSKNPYSLSTFVLTSLLANSVALLVLFPISFFLELDRTTFLAVILIGLWKFGTAFCDVVYGYHQRQTNMAPIAKLQIAHCVCNSIAFNVALFAAQDILIAIGLLAVVNLGMFLLYDLRTVDPRAIVSDLRADFQSHFRRAISIIGVTWPLGLGGAVFALNMLIPRKMLASFFTLEEVGLFSLLAFCARLGTPVMQAIGQAASRQLSVSIQNRDSSKVVRLLRKVVAIPLSIGLVLVAVGWFCGPSVLGMVFGEAYEFESCSVAYIMIYATFTYVSTFLTYTLIVAGKHFFQLAILTVTVLTSLLACYWLVPEMNVQGACLGLMVSSIVRMLGTGLAIFIIIQKLGSGTSSANPPI